MSTNGMKFLNELQSILDGEDPFAGTALRESIEYAKLALPGHEVSAAIVHLALTIGEFRRKVASIKADAEGKLTAINSKTA